MKAGSMDLKPSSQQFSKEIFPVLRSIAQKRPSFLLMLLRRTDANSSVVLKDIISHILEADLRKIIFEDLKESVDGNSALDALLQSEQEDLTLLLLKKILAPDYVSKQNLIDRFIGSGFGYGANFLMSEANMRTKMNISQSKLFSSIDDKIQKDILEKLVALEAGTVKELASSQIKELTRVLLNQNADPDFFLKPIFSTKPLVEGKHRVLFAAGLKVFEKDEKITDISELKQKFEKLQSDPKYSKHYQMAKDAVKLIRRQNGEGFFTRVSEEGKRQIKKAEDAMFVKLVGKYEAEKLPKDIQFISTEFKDKFNYPIGEDRKPEKRGFFSALFKPISFVVSYGFGAEFKEDFDSRIKRDLERRREIAQDKSVAKNVVAEQESADKSWFNNKDFIEVSRAVVKAGIAARGGLVDDSMKDKIAEQAIDIIALRLVEHFAGSRGVLANNFPNFNFEKESAGAKTNGLSKLPSTQKLGEFFGQFLQFNSNGKLAGIDDKKLRDVDAEVMSQKFSEAKNAVEKPREKSVKQFFASSAKEVPAEFPQSDYQDIANAIVKAGIRMEFKETTIQESKALDEARAKVLKNLRQEYLSPKALRNAFSIDEERKLMGDGDLWKNEKVGEFAAKIWSDLGLKVEKKSNTLSEAAKAVVAGQTPRHHLEVQSSSPAAARPQINPAVSKIIDPEAKAAFKMLGVAVEKAIRRANGDKGDNVCVLNGGKLLSESIEEILFKEYEGNLWQLQDDFSGFEFESDKGLSKRSETAQLAAAFQGSLTFNGSAITSFNASFKFKKPEKIHSEVAEVFDNVAYAIVKSAARLLHDPKWRPIHGQGNMEVKETASLQAARNAVRDKLFAEYGKDKDALKKDFPNADKKEGLSKDKEVLKTAGEIKENLGLEIDKEKAGKLFGAKIKVVNCKPNLEGVSIKKQSQVLPIEVSGKTIKLEEGSSLRINPQRHLIYNSLDKIVKHYDEQISKSPDLKLKETLAKKKIDAVNSMLFERTSEGIQPIKFGGDTLGIFQQVFFRACNSYDGQDQIRNKNLSDFYSAAVENFKFLGKRVEEKTQKQEVEDVTEAFKALLKHKVISKDKDSSAVNPSQDTLEKVVNDGSAAFSSKVNSVGKNNIVSKKENFADKYPHCASITAKVRAGHFDSGDGQVSWTQRIQKSTPTRELS